jgi:hypothetical protein
MTTAFGKYERVNVLDKHIVFAADAEMCEALAVAAKDTRQSKTGLVRYIIAEWLLREGYLRKGDRDVVQG